MTYDLSELFHSRSHIWTFPVWHMICPTILSHDMWPVRTFNCSICNVTFLFTFSFWPTKQMTLAMVLCMFSGILDRNQNFAEQYLLPCMTSPDLVMNHCQVCSFAKFAWLRMVFHLYESAFRNFALHFQRICQTVKNYYRSKRKSEYTLLILKKIQSDPYCIAKS